MDGLSHTYAELLTGNYDCVDRIVLNAYFRMGHDAGGFRIWWRALTGSEETLDNAHLMRMAGRLSRRLRAWAIAHNVPIRDCAVGEDRHAIAEEYLAKTNVREGLFLILVGKAPAPVWNIQSNRHISRKKPNPYVNQYFFHILDREWGHVTIKMSGHPPFPALIMLNGHEYLDRQARKAGILFTKQGNCFTRFTQAVAFAKIAGTFTDTSGIGRLSEVCDRWIYTTCLCFALDLQEQEHSGFRYQYSVYQFEYSRNLIFETGAQMQQVFEGLVGRNRVRMDLKRLRTILGATRRRWVRRRRKLEDWQVTIERPSYDMTIFKLHCGKLALKIYSEGERVLRAEAIANHAAALRCGRPLEKFAELVTTLQAILERFLDALSCMDRCFIADTTLDDLPTASVVGATRVGGIDMNRARMRSVSKALLALSVMPGGFTAWQIAKHVREANDYSETEYGPREAAYDLKKFRGKGIVRRLGKSRKYETTLEGVRTISALVLLRDKVIAPRLSATRLDRLSPESICPTTLDAHYETLRQAMLATFNELGIAA